MCAVTIPPRVLWERDHPTALALPRSHHNPVHTSACLGSARRRPEPLFRVRQLLTSSFDTTARLWDAATGQLIRVFSGSTNIVDVVAFSPDGPYVAASGEDPTVRVWEAGTGQQVMDAVKSTKT